MGIISTTVALATAAVLGTAVQEPKPEVTIYRSWRPPNVGTMVEGMFRVDSELLGTNSCIYGVQLIVRDASGNALKQEQWDGRCPEQDGVLSAALETFRFAMPDTSALTVEVAVYPQGQQDRRRVSTIQVQGLSVEPKASDLILAREVGFVEKGDEEQWTFTHGTIGLRTSSQAVVEPDQPALGYYLELYPEGRPMTGTVQGVVRRADGKELARFKLQDLDSLAVPQPLAGNVPLEGLPAGAYHFETHVQLADTSFVRSHPFYVSGGALASAGGAGWFATLTDDQIRELFDPVVVWLTASEAAQYQSLTTDGRRVFLARQFGNEAPTPGDGQESALDAYLARVETVNSRFAERGGGREPRPAWQTDRGRIYLLRGEPNTTLTRPSPEGGNPFEVWHYAAGQSLAYVFADDTRMGNYRLVYSNDPGEKAVPDWTRYVGSEALHDLMRLGIRVGEQQNAAPPPSLESQE